MGGGRTISGHAEQNVGRDEEEGKVSPLELAPPAIQEAVQAQPEQVTQPSRGEDDLL